MEKHRKLGLAVSMSISASALIASMFIARSAMAGPALVPNNLGLAEAAHAFSSMTAAPAAAAATIPPQATTVSISALNALPGLEKLNNTSAATDKIPSSPVIHIIDSSTTDSIVSGLTEE